MLGASYLKPLIVFLDALLLSPADDPADDAPEPGGVWRAVKYLVLMVIVGPLLVLCLYLVFIGLILLFRGGT